MSFLKFWSSKKSGSKKDDDKHIDDPELEKRRLRHSLSISRSGRFKQRKRERSQIMDKPEIFNIGGVPDAGPSPTSSSSSSSLSSQPHSDTESCGRYSGASTASSSYASGGGEMHHQYMGNSSGGGGHFRSASPARGNSPYRNRNSAASSGIRSPSGSHRMKHPVVT